LEVDVFWSYIDSPTTQVFSMIIRSKKLEIQKKKIMGKLNEPSDENQTECHEIEPNRSKDRTMPEEDNSSYWDEFINFTFFWTFQFIILLRIWRYQCITDIALYLFFSLLYMYACAWHLLLIQSFICVYVLVILNNYFSNIINTILNLFRKHSEVTFRV
jgi:hypothetical protein